MLVQTTNHLLFFIRQFLLLPFLDYCVKWESLQLVKFMSMHSNHRVQMDCQMVTRSNFMKLIEEKALSSSTLLQTTTMANSTNLKYFDNF